MTPAISLVALVLLTISSSAVALGPAAVNLGTAANYAVLGQTGISTVPPSVITGAIGVSPASSTFLTGFSQTLDSTGTFSTSSQVVGKLFAASYASPTPSTLTTAISNLQAAYLDASGRANPNFSNLGSGEIGGQTLTAGLYKWSSGVTVSSDVTIFGTALDTFIFQIPGTLSVSSGKQVILTGGVLAENIVWAVGGSTTLGSTSAVSGIILGKTSITLQTGTTVNGRVLSQTLVALQKSTVTSPA